MFRHLLREENIQHSVTPHRCKGESHCNYYLSSLEITKTPVIIPQNTDRRNAFYQPLFMSVEHICVLLPWEEWLLAAAPLVSITLILFLSLLSSTCVLSLERKESLLPCTSCCSYTHTLSLEVFPCTSLFFRMSAHFPFDSRGLVYSLPRSKGWFRPVYWRHPWNILRPVKACGLPDWWSLSFPFLLQNPFLLPWSLSWLTTSLFFSIGARSFSWKLLVLSTPLPSSAHHPQPPIATPTAAHTLALGLKSY